MSETTVGLRRKISIANDLQSVVRTMKASAASSIGQYEKSVTALTDYYHTVQLGLHICLQQNTTAPLLPQASNTMSGEIGAVVFGSDQGLVGQFNDEVADFALKSLATMRIKPKVWAVGERVHARLTDAGIPLAGTFNLPTSINNITALIGKILVAGESLHYESEITELHLFYNQMTSEAAYSPVDEQLLPLDETWRRKLIKIAWPTKHLPEIMSGGKATLRALIREYLFVSLFRACAESLASENASRLAAMQRADKNIDDLLENLNRTFHRLRQSSIDEELFDVISGFEAMKGKRQM